MNNERIEYTILRNLIFNEDYTRKVLPFINEIFFPKREEQILFQEINTFVLKYFLCYHQTYQRYVIN